MTGIFYGHLVLCMYRRLVLLVVIWYIFPNLVCLDQEKSGNPVSKSKLERSNKKRLNEFFIGVKDKLS
jgi:hypothetical protein